LEDSFFDGGEYEADVGGIGGLRKTVQGSKESANHVWYIVAY
jgi:hypothetical protein